MAHGGVLARLALGRLDPGEQDCLALARVLAPGPDNAVGKAAQLVVNGQALV